MQQRSTAATVEHFLDNPIDHDLVVFSHLRWDFVFQRPQHLMTQFAKHRRVFFFEEPVLLQFEQPHLRLTTKQANIQVAVPCLPAGLTESEKETELAKLVDELIRQEDIENFTAWYYTPMALPFTRQLEPEIVIYDCMDELSAFKGAPPELLELENELFDLADLVFTGGRSLYEAKRNRHPDVHCFPSSIDRAHFGRARTKRAEIVAPPKGRIQVGFYGVLDERFDIALLDGIARLRPEWEFVMIGPVVKIDPNSLPQQSNIQYPGMKSYAELPDYLARWDLAILPFAKNESTRYISPTKTPEYLAAGCPVVSTSITDVVTPYGDEKLVYIADTPEEFVACAEKAIEQAKRDQLWLQRVDAFLSDKSWEQTCTRMLRLESQAREAKTTVAPISLLVAKKKPYVNTLKA